MPLRPASRVAALLGSVIGLLASPAGAEDLPGGGELGGAGDR